MPGADVSIEFHLQIIALLFVRVLLALLNKSLKQLGQLHFA